MATSMLFGVRLPSGAVMRRSFLIQCHTRPERCGKGLQVIHRSWSESQYKPKRKGWWRTPLRITVALGIGIAVLGPKTANQQIERVYKRLPLEAFSRLVGRLSEIELRDWLRKPLLGLYVRFFQVDLSEAADEDLTHYSSIGEFFRRPLKPGARPVDELHDLTCPSDGKILHFGEVQDGTLEQVKGVSYSLRHFLGHSTWINGPLTENVQFLSDEEYYQTLQIQPGNSLYYCIVYLAPGNYHRFHSAVDWTITYRRHFPGSLLSVNPRIAERVQDLFNYNERVVYFGTWKHGLFAYIPVGATNVGSIKVYCDKDLATNSTENKGMEFIDKVYPNGVKVKKGEMFGEFNMGSTVVLVFEAPKDFKFTCENRQHVKCGIALGNDRRVDSEKDQQETKC
ncbi:phosphatidylserine decarboxylase proenzyme, mitochondrial-like [Mizuhopecten yessoensis]|uniref:Phosphatidylserine decarboxylase proenzyme, mitochondrial n=1 Tax=Mizuhopecten yessoensis TaxID=6573 RepID=A0A210Q1V9_MIZYE|nr:phosphatidylserine decarboxylase proenzyme, mitochondrial-like [Mizuhopecten yessoensis]OWF42679.1 Phosphatidylserine decarboxylase proenzyme [Mizuhopecten yessoensis]